MLQIENLHKRFGKIQAVGGVSLEVRQGEIFGLLGPNGAGKTTTLSIVSGLLRPDEGSVRYGDIDLASEPVRFKSTLGVVPQETALYEELTARQNLRFWAGMYGLAGGDLKAAVDRALEQVGLSARADEKVKGFSGGMKRRLNLSLGLAHGPKVVLLDEPTVGIDPQARLNILDVIRDVASSGTSVLYTTHHLEEAEKLCDRIAIMDHGKLLEVGTLDELKRMVGEEEVVTVRGDFDSAALQARIAGNGVTTRSAEPGRIVLATGAGRSAQLLERIFSGGFPVSDITIEPPSLNGLFLKLTGRELRD